MQRGRLLAPAHELIGRPGHGGDDDCHLVPGIYFALDVAGNAADALDIGDRGAAKLHYQAGHNALVRLSISVGRLNPPISELGLLYGAPQREKARIDSHGFMRPQPRLRRASVKSPAGLEHDSTVDADEVARFSAIAAEWWDPRGKHAECCTVSTRSGSAFIKETLAASSAADCNALRCARGTAHSGHRLWRRHLERAVGAHGCEASWAPIPQRPILPRRKLHAEQSDLSVDYRATTAAALADARRALRCRARHGGGRACR